MKICVRSVAVAQLLLAGSVSLGQSTFTLIGNMPGSTGGSTGAAISADGLVVVGMAVVPSASAPGGQVRHAFRWSAATGMIDLGDFGTARGSSATAVNADGSVVVGVGSGEQRAFRWTQGGGVQELAGTASAFTDARAISGDGQLISGSMWSLTERNSVRWSGVSSYEVLNPPGTVAAVGGMSADGSRIAGWTEVPSGRAAYLWTQSGGFVNLGATPNDGGQQYVEVGGMSGNGAFIVGAGDDDSVQRTRAFRWSALGGYEYLSPAVLSHARAASFDGSVIVGDFTTGSSQNAFYWTAAQGMVDLKSLLIQNGATGLNGWTLDRCTGVSADGMVVTGTAVNASQQVSAFIAVIPAPSAALPLLALGLGVRRRR